MFTPQFEFTQDKVAISIEKLAENSCVEIQVLCVAWKVIFTWLAACLFASAPRYCAETFLQRDAVDLQ